MTNQRHHMNLSIASPTEIERTAQQLRTIREKFLTTGNLAAIPTIPRPIILNSWQRCNTLHVNPGQRFAPLAIAREAQLYNLREANELLIRATRSVMSHLTDFLAGSGYVIVLSDANGCLLDVLGDAAIRRRLARIDFVPGGNGQLSTYPPISHEHVSGCGPGGLTAIVCTPHYYAWECAPNGSGCIHSQFF